MSRSCHPYRPMNRPLLSRETAMTDDPRRAGPDAETLGADGVPKGVRNANPRFTFCCDDRAGATPTYQGVQHSVIPPKSPMESKNAGDDARCPKRRPPHRRDSRERLATLFQGQSRIDLAKKLSSGSTRYSTTVCSPVKIMTSDRHAWPQLPMDLLHGLCRLNSHLKIRGST
jgi:hypothetical protein